MMEEQTTKVTDVHIGPCNVTFSRGQDSTPRSEVVDRNVTIVTDAQPGSPPHFLVEFTITIATDSFCVPESSEMILRFPISRIDNRASYREVQLEAARQLAPILRSAADHVEKQVAERDREYAEVPRD